MNEHHEHVAAQVDNPLGLVGRIAERVLLGLREGAESIAAPVGSLEVGPHAIASPIVST